MHTFEPFLPAKTKAVIPVIRAVRDRTFQYSHRGRRFHRHKYLLHKLHQCPYGAYRFGKASDRRIPDLIGARSTKSRQDFRLYRRYESSSLHRFENSNPLLRPFITIVREHRRIPGLSQPDAGVLWKSRYIKAIAPFVSWKHPLESLYTFEGVSHSQRYTL